MQGNAGGVRLERGRVRHLFLLFLLLFWPGDEVQMGKMGSHQSKVRSIDSGVVRLH